MAETITEKIARLEALKESGARSTTVDGVSVTFRDLGEINSEIGRLKRECPQHRVTRPRVATMNLRNA